MNAAPLRMLALVVLLMVSVSSAGPVYDATADFSSANNPSGAWSYGSGSGAGFSAFTTNNGGAWTGPDLPAGVGQQFNTTPASISLHSDLLWLIPTAVIPNGLSQSATVRWTAPSAGNYSINAELAALAGSAGGTSPVVTIFHNGMSEDTRALSAGHPFDFDRVFALGAGDTIDFVNPPNLPQADLGVSLKATVQPAAATQVPLPGAFYAFFPTAGLAALTYKKVLRRWK